jgi:hypothetical protein
VVEDLAEAVSRSTDFNGADTYATDLRLSEYFEPDDRLKAAIGDDVLVMYHATRLMPHEVEWCRHEGIGPLTEQLRERKLIEAQRRYPEQISIADADLLLRSGPLSWERVHRGRLGQLWVVAPVGIFDYHRGFEDLLGDWRGESIAWAGHSDTTCRSIIDRVNGLSKPTVLELGVSPRLLCSWKYQWPIFVGNMLGLIAPWNEWVVSEHLGPESMFDVIQPGGDRWRASWVTSRDR